LDAEHRSIGRFPLEGVNGERKATNGDEGETHLVQELERLRAENAALIERVNDLEVRVCGFEHVLDQCPLAFLLVDTAYKVNLSKGRSLASLELPKDGAKIDALHPLHSLVETALAGHEAMAHRLTLLPRHVNTRHHAKEAY